MIFLILNQKSRLISTCKDFYYCLNIYDLGSVDTFKLTTDILKLPYLSRLKYLDMSNNPKITGISFLTNLQKKD